jgi:hypothetical protein
MAISNAGADSRLLDDNFYHRADRLFLADVALEACIGMET